MNKKILTKVISFVLVLCLLVPVIPAIGLDFGGVRASAASLPTNAFYFKAGSTNYWKSSAKVSTGYQVISVDGVTYIPVDMIAHAYGLSASELKNDSVFASRVQTVEGGSTEYVAAINGEQIYSGYYTYVSNMNLVAVSTSTSNVFNNVSDDSQIDLMKQFIFDNMNYSGNKVSAVTASDLKSDHPYLMADQTQFDKLYAVYIGLDNSDPVLKSYLNSIVEDYQGIYKSYALEEDGLYAGLNKSAGLVEGQSSLDKIPYRGNNGYDVGGRLGHAVTHSQNVMRLAYLYQITRELKYAELALDYALALCNWEHWGAGHFLNAADTGYNMALAYDWCYDIWGTIDTRDQTSDRNIVRDSLLTKVVYAALRDEGFTYSVKSGTFGNTSVEFWCPWLSPAVGEGNIYGEKDNNWNGVCSSGAIMAALAVGHETGSVSGLTITTINPTDGYSSPSGKAGQTHGILSWDYSYKGLITSYTSTVKVPEAWGTTYQSMALYVINRDLYMLEKNGLGQYIPDGSYVESASYWSYGTNSIFRTIASLESTCGTDFGLSAAWGLDRTAYFANYVQSSDGDVWKYHDHGGSDSSMDTSMNMIFGASIGDDNLVGYRKYLIEKGATKPHIFDTLKYDKDVNGFDAMALDYYMEGIDGYTVRDSWENEGIYAGFMGGLNNVSHGQMDSGAFVYYNNGTQWFQDIGTENYNAGGFGYGTSVTTFRYYPSTSEGNNVLVHTGLTYGQDWDGNAQITKYGSTKQGSYAVLDQTSVYDSLGSGTSAKRGMLLTNDRKTFVVQDEVSLPSAGTLYWFGHLLDSIQIDISADGKTAYLYDGNSTMRCTLVSDNANLKFTEMDCAYSDTDTQNPNWVLDYTADWIDYSVNNGGKEPQNDYSGWHKLAVKCENVKTLNLAIVIEELAPGDNSEVGYTWTSMDTWTEATVLGSDDSAYDNKVLLDKNFDQAGIGSFSSSNGNFRVLNVLDGADNVMYAIPASNTGAANITLAAAEGKTASSSIGNGMLITEFDLKAANFAAGEVSISIYGTDIYPIVTFDMSELTPYTSDWTHVTLVLDEQTNTMYLYAGETLVKSESYKSKSFQKLKLVVSSDGGSAIANSSAYFMLDNAVIRTFTEKYTALDSVLSGSSSITDWTDREVQSESSIEATGRIAKLFNAAANADGAETDTPIVDFWGDLGSASELNPQGVVLSDESGEEIYVDTFAALAEEINSGRYTNAELYASNINPIVITSKIIVDTNGHDFYATSPNLICQVSGEIYTFKSGTITVVLVMNGTERRIAFTSTDYLSYNVDSSQLGKIYEKDNGDGTFTYIATEQNCWALTRLGDPTSGRDLLVTSKNNRFYLTGYEYEGSYVTVDANGNVTAGGDPAGFFTALRTSHHKISVTNDFYYDSSYDGGYGNTTVNNNVYLNGHTITYYSNDTEVGDPIFSVGTTVLNVYGPGTIDNTAPVAKVIMKAGYNATATTFNNLTIYSNSTITDHRSGTLEFNNCNITMRTGRHALGTDNRATAEGMSFTQANAITDTAKMPVLKVMGGVINSTAATGTNASIQVRDNARLVVGGGLQINCPGTYGAIFLYLSEATRSNGQPDYHVLGIDHMYVHIGEVYHNNGNGMFCYMDETILNDYNEDTTGSIEKPNQSTYAPTFAGKAMYVEGAGFASESDVEYAIEGSHVLAKSGDAGYAYKVVKATDAATVTWSGANITEKWVAGATPTMSDDVKNYLKNNVSALSGYLRTYSIETVASGGVYTFSPIYMPDLSIKMAMALYTQFNVVISVEAHSAINYVMINGTRHEIAEAELADGYYVFKLDDIAPADAGNLITVVVNAKDNNGNANNITATTSIVNYADSIMANANKDAKTKTLMSSIISYIGACSAYEGNTYTNASCQVIVDRHSSFKSSAELLSQAPDTSKVKDAVKSAYLDLGGSPAYVFRFNSTFTGTVTLTYETVDSNAPVVVTLNVVDGKVGGSDTYKLVLKAYDMATDINIAVGSNSATYNLSVYYTQAVQSQDALYDLLCALYSYCNAAKAYKA